MEKMDGKTMDIVAENVDKLKGLFPEAFTEGKVDFEALKELLGTFVDDRDERYSFTWNGKSKARMIAQTPSTGTLRPCKEESVDWDATQNIFIEGDNLEVLKLLQKSYHKKVKMIYIDPPYNTGKDFVYKDNFKDNIKNYKEITGQVDGEGRNLSNNPETSGRYHTDWLNMMYPRLKLARNLLKDDGVIFISIDDNEVTNLRKICDEIYGEESFVTTIHLQMSSVQGQKVKVAKEGNIVKNAEYLLVYSKSGKKAIAKNVLYEASPYDTHYSLYIEKANVGYTERPLSSVLIENITAKELLESVGLFNGKKITNNNIAKAYDTNLDFRNLIHEMAGEIVSDDKTSSLNLPDNLKLEPGKVIEYVSQDRTYLLTKNSNDNVRQRMRLSEKINQANDFRETYGCTTIRGDWWPEFYKDMGNVSKEGNIVFANGKKPIRLIQQIAYMVGINDDDIVLDFFAGSATTAHSLFLLNKKYNSKSRFVLIQLPEILEKNKTEHKQGYSFCIENNLKPYVSEISKERIRRAAAKIKEENPEYDGDLGFKVFKLDSTNIKPWEVDFDMTERTLEDFISNIKTDRREEDVLYEILLKYGLDLTLPISEHNIAGQKVFDIGMGALIICLADAISLDVVEGMAKLKEELNPEIMRVVFKDSGFKDDVVKTNAVQILKQAGIVDVRSL